MKGPDGSEYRETTREALESSHSVNGRRRENDTGGMQIKHHVSNHYCAGRWHSECDECGWFYYGECTFREVLRRIRLHQLDREFVESSPPLVPAFPEITAA